LEILLQNKNKTLHLGKILAIPLGLAGCRVVKGGRSSREGFF
jgi:hypothetical protein